MSHATAHASVTSGGDAPNAAGVHRFEVRVREGLDDPRAATLIREASQIGVSIDAARVARVYLIEAPLSEAQRNRLGNDLLANPVTESWRRGVAPVAGDARCVEVHPLPGVMDPPAQTVTAAVEELLGIEDVSAATGWRWDLTGLSPAEADRVARRLLANPVVHAIHTEPFQPDALPHGSPAPFEVRMASIRDLDDDALMRLSREGSMFLSLDEMKAIQAEYGRLGREPTDIELETLAQTWSEHCVHKTLKSRIRYRGPKDDAIRWEGRPGHTIEPDGAVLIDNLLRSTVAAATQELIDDGLDWTLSVFVDNAGVIAFDDAHAVCVKVETHNHPSAIEPYGGAATGVGGCIRDILGTGLAAKPIANTDVFCVAPHDSFTDENLPSGCLHPRRILEQVVAGVRDYGNRVGVPTVSGAVFFDDRYVGNPLVYCGSVGVMPRDKIKGEAQKGDRIVAIGGRTGRDGIHGATFSSAELTDTHADEFAHAVQIGNPVEEKKVIDAVLRARDADGGPLFSAITDCGAGGFSSAIGEMGEALGADVHLERAPLKYEGLTYDEIWISEAQERMVLAVPPENLDALRAICEEESVELADLGEFGTPGRELVLNYNGREVGRLSMAFLHEGLPQRTREAAWSPPSPPGRGDGGEGQSALTPERCETNPSPERQRGVAEAVRTTRHGSDRQSGSSAEPATLRDSLLNLLAHPDVASKRWIVRQYDHEVQGATIIKPLVGPGGEGPGDASVIEPVPGSGKGLAISQGLSAPAGDPARGGDPYIMALCAVDECVRNLVCVGADPERIAILDNFCWPSCEKPENLGSLVRAAEGCYDAAKAHRTPFVSGKDSLNNQFTTDDGRTIEIPPTLLITGVGIVPDVNRCVTMDAKREGGALVLVEAAGDPRGLVDTAACARAARTVAALIRDGLVRAAHDCSEGGALVAVAEMLIASGLDGRRFGAALKGLEPAKWLAEAPGRYVLEVDPTRLEEIMGVESDGVSVRALGSIDDSGVIAFDDLEDVIEVDVAAERWLGTLDW